MSFGIIVKGSPFVHGKTSSSQKWNYRKDILHRERKELENNLKETIFTKDQMNQVDCHNEQEENKRTQDYIKWKETKDNFNLTNEQKMARFHEINKEFKQHNEEGKSFDTDMLRQSKNIKYD